jgi:hypothetical protein
MIVNTGNRSSSTVYYTAVSIDAAGKVVLFKETGTGTDTFSGLRVYSADNTLVKEISVSSASVKGIYGPTSENGTVEHVVIQYQYESYRSYFAGVNLVTGSVSSEFRVNTSYASQGINSYFSSGGVTYLYSAGWYLNGGAYYCNSGFAVAYNGNSVSATSAGTINSYDENYAVSDRIFTALFGDNSSAAKTSIKISAFPKTLAQETAEIIGKFANKNTFIGNIGTTAGQIKASVDVPKPTVKITANNSGNLSLNNLSLMPGRKYYYEYDMKTLDDSTKSSLNGITASTGTIASNQYFSSDTLYVTESYEEDFNDSEINSFFTINDPGVLLTTSLSGNISEGVGYGAANGSAKEGKNDDYMNLSFVVPDGKMAILSMDYAMYYYNAGRNNNRESYYSGSNVFVDGQTFRDKDEFGNNWDGKYREYDKDAIFYKILYPGTHTIECRVSSGNWYHVLIDNLKVDLVSYSPKQSPTTFNIANGDSQGWYSLSGDFVIQDKTISYGSQDSSRYYGGLPAEVVETYYYKKKGTYHNQVVNYYQTVPAGYIQKGKVHLGSDYLSQYDYNKYKIDSYPEARYEKCEYVNVWRPLQPRTEGTYTHVVTMGHPEDDQGWLDVFDLVTYPVNAVTVTGNMAFNYDNTKYFFPKVTSTEKTNLSMFLPKGEYYLKNLRVYYMENGRRVYLENKGLENISELADWNLSFGLTATNISVQEEEKDDEYVKVYKKGEKVLYNIFYDDYEADPSKTQYWQYSHINWPPDTVHPDAGKILNAPIDRFYLAGKYTVTHWQQDNTQRTGTEGDATPYNKESNKVSLTFYVDGGGIAPWITYIKTNPATVEYDDSYTIKVGVDDEEKDTLKLETEVFLDGVRIKSDIKSGIVATNGTYPEQTITGLPKAVKGTYQVICTVSDYSGTGIKSYKFKVEGISAEAEVEATPALKSGYGIWSTVRTVTENCTAARVVAVLPSGATVNMIKTGGSGDSLTWQFPANAGKYAEQYNSKFRTISRQVFVPVKWPDNTYYTITYNVYDPNGVLLVQISSKTYINGNMYDDDYTVRSK